MFSLDVIICLSHGVRISLFSTRYRFFLAKVGMMNIFTIIVEMKGWSFQKLSAYTSNLSMMVTCSSFIWLEPITLWLISEDSEIKMTSDDISWLSACIELSSFISGIPCGILADRWGRKNFILSVGPTCFIPWLLAFFTRDLVSMYIIRLLQGFAEGACFAIGPTYIAEISSPNIRGTLGGHTVVLMYLGFLYSFCTGSYLKYQNYLYTQAILPVIFFISFIFMPESPYYLLMKKKRKEAYEALTWLRGGEDVTEELNTIEEAVEEDLCRKGTWKDLFATKTDRRAFFIVQIVNLATYMTGVITVSMYATKTFVTTSLLWVTATQLTILMSIVLCISALLASFVADSIGRRKLLIISSTGITISNLIISIYYYLAEKTSIDVTQTSWVLFIGLLGLCILTNIGVGELVHTIQAEFFPSHTRSIGGGVTTAISTAAIFISVKAYQPLIDMFGVYMNFLGYTVISFTATVLIVIYVTESTGKTMAEINKDISVITKKKTTIILE